DRRERRVLLVAPADVEAHVEAEEQDRDAAGPLRPPRRRALEREAEVDAEEVEAEDGDAERPADERVEVERRELEEDVEAELARDVRLVDAAEQIHVRAELHGVRRHREV